MVYYSSLLLHWLEAPSSTYGMQNDCQPRDSPPFFRVLVPLIVVFLTLFTYPGMIVDSLMQDLTSHPIDIKLRNAEIAVTGLAIVYSFVVKLLMIPQRPSPLSIKEG